MHSLLYMHSCGRCPVCVPSRVSRRSHRHVDNRPIVRAVLFLTLFRFGVSLRTVSASLRNNSRNLGELGRHDQQLRHREYMRTRLSGISQPLFRQPPTTLDDTACRTVRCVPLILTHPCRLIPAIVAKSDQQCHLGLAGNTPNEKVPILKPNTLKIVAETVDYPSVFWLFWLFGTSPSGSVSR